MTDPLIPGAGRPPGWRDRLLAGYRRRGWLGFTRLYNLLMPLHGRRLLRVVSRYDTQFYLSPWDSVDSHVIAEGFYESEVLEAVRPYLGSGAVLWVVGANFGLHAITAKHLHPDTLVVAFEPAPAMAARLLESCALNGLSVDLHAYALSDRAGAFPFYANASGNPGMSTLHPVRHFHYDQRYSVATLTAAAVVEHGLAPPPTALIVDVEGAEAEVLRGFGPHLENARLRALVCEAPNEFLVSKEPTDLYALLQGAGFRLQLLPRREKTAHTLSNFVATRA